MRRNKKGIALIFTVGVLALMVLIGTSFALNMMVDYKSSVNMAVSAQAKDAAEAGLNLAIISARNLALTDFNGVPAAAMSGSLGDVGRGNTAAYSVKITDTASQINVNDANPSLGTMLENLVAILGSPLQAGDGNAIITNRPAGGYLTKEQIIDAIPGANLAAKTAKFNKIADYITINSYIDENSGNSTAPPLTGLYNPPYSYYQPKAPVNINTAGLEVLQAVLRGVVSDNSKVSALAAAIITQRGITLFRTWNDLAANGGFDNFIDNVSISPALTSAERTDIKNNANPNRVKPSTYTTDFCFQPSGVYEIISTGTVGASAQKTITTVVRIYNILNYTTKEQFRADYYAGGPDLPVFSRATWLNSCPVEINNADQGISMAPNYTTIPNSLKLGFWDNFDEDNDNNNSFGYSWRNFSQDPLHPMHISDPYGSGSNKLWGTSYPKFTLDSSRWTFGNNFSLRVFLRPNPIGLGNNDSGNIEFHRNLSPVGKLWIQCWSFLYHQEGPDNWVPTDITLPAPFWRPTVDADPDTTPEKGKDYFDSKVFLDMWDPPTNERIYNVGSLYGLTDLETDHFYNWASELNLNQSQYHGVFPDYEKFKLIVNSALPSPNYRVYIALGPGKHLSYDANGGSLGWSGYPASVGYVAVPFHDDAFNSLSHDRYDYYRSSNNQPNTWQCSNWYLVLYGNNATPTWDDVRIIPNSGYYQSPSFSPGGQVCWGTASWTLTIPDTANAGKELCSVQLNTGAGLNNVAINGPIGGVSSSEVFRVNLTSTDDDYSETPVLEDITITYLPKVQILYLR